MPFIGVFESNNKYYLFCDKNQYLEASTMERKAPRQYNIQRFNNFVVCYKGSPSDMQKFAKAFKLDEFPEPLTKEFLWNHFYANYLDFVVHQTDCKMNKGLIEENPFEIFIVGKDYAFDISEEYLYEVHGLHAVGNDSLAFFLYENLCDTCEPIVLIKHIMDKCNKHLVNACYPYWLLSSDDLDTLQTIYANGEVKTEKLQKFWERK